MVDACRAIGAMHSCPSAVAKHFGAILRQCYSTMRGAEVTVRKCRVHMSEPAIGGRGYSTWRGNFVADAEAKAAVGRRPPVDRGQLMVLDQQV